MNLRETLFIAGIALFIVGSFMEAFKLGDGSYIVSAGVITAFLFSNIVPREK